MNNLYMPELALVDDIKEETPNIRTLTISLKSRKPLSALPGQFVELTIFGYGEFPVSVSAVLGPTKDRLQTTIQRIGRVTKETANLSVGSTIGIRGPFGNGFPLAEMKGKNICIVTGGVGLAAVRYLINYIIENRDHYGKLQLLHGARTPGDLIYKDFLFNKEKAQEQGIEILLTVDQPDTGWEGHVGVVTELFKRTTLDPVNTMAVVCGPSIMMKFATQCLSDMGFGDDQILVSMERRMQCGMGMCGHCMVGQKRVCLDGPVFTYGSIKEALERAF
ncbi:Dihydroorotate dehydrogenase, electron transfer subunit, iron-sulfur cluster binding domain protein [Desulfofundulus kuznetsovii DSM 6115]|uniref:Dihydroorotate dehydrogenase, electron transfer subunit, iron-sulfur cluster binding domain protein n=1 Tax=Desulfofundulus kuznetsovii (strain DSM 6115 / VKM B-1805 / 17) TaxID=760568 RepID=A0AAU8PSG5_DESK7|nr:Dihydroorotate dehydrogenase, electron transfer subunit, iron-sulfur cluster binding domain protein [Desulfofundulus kuznetsovii DSM 6115]